MELENHSQSSAGDSWRRVVLPSNLYVAIASLDDLEQVCLLVEAAALESPYSSFPLDKEYLRAFVSNILQADISTHIIIVLKDKDEIIGLLVGLIDNSHPLLHSFKVANELLWWVHPQYRGRKDAFALVEAYEEWAKVFGCNHIHLAHFSNDVGTKLSKRYKQMGYTEVEVSYTKELI